MTDTQDDEEESAHGIDIFQEPDGFYQEEKDCTFQMYTLSSGFMFNLRLIGHSPLWGHHLWPASTVLAEHLLNNPSLTRNRTILELGAGAALPSLFCALPTSHGGGGAAKVVATDYPDADLVANIAFNIGRNFPSPAESVAVAEGYVWGAPTTELTAHLGEGEQSFDTLILSDVLFNHSQHAALATTVRLALKRAKHARALVFFTPHRPWLMERDLDFFNVLGCPLEEGASSRAQEGGEERLDVRKCALHILDRPMFPEDQGDVKLRSTVFGYEVFWTDLQ